MNQESANQVPMVAMPQNDGYPTVNNMTTNNTASQGATEQINSETHNEQGESSLLRLRGGGCIKDCLAAIGCCFVCEECCC